MKPQATPSSGWNRTDPPPTYLGDLFHHPAEVVHLDWVWPGRDQPRMLSSRRALVEAALASDALLLNPHMRFPGAGNLRHDSSTLEWVPVDPSS